MAMRTAACGNEHESGEQQRIYSLCTELYDLVIIGNESVLYPLDDDSELCIASLNTAATIVAIGCVNCVPQEAIQDIMTERFGIDPERAKADISHCINELRAMRAVRCMS